MPAPLIAFALESLLPTVKDVIGGIVKRIPDPAERERTAAEAEKTLIAALIQSSNDQVEINKIEAASPSLFVAGWRPAIGWVCAAGLAYQFLGRPALAAAGYVATPLDGTLMELVIAMLGLGAMRTFEKFKGVTR